MYEIIINPASRSGRGWQYWKRLQPYLEQHDIPYSAHISAHSGHIAQIMQDLTKDLTDASALLSIIILGGDGTVNEALQGIVRFDKVRLSYIPTGSSNDLARDLGIPTDPIEAFEHILHHPICHRMDIGCVTYKDCRTSDSPIHTRYFAVSCGLGYDAAICQEVMHSKLKKVLNRCGLGKLVYVMIALKQLACTKPLTAELTMPGQETIRLDNYLFLTGMNHQYEGGGFMFAPRTDDRDGYLDLCGAVDLPKLKLLCILPTAYKGKHLRFKGVIYHHTADYHLKVSSPLWLHTDGETPAWTDEIHVSTLPQALEFLY